MISTKRQFLFVHVPKTAGNSIQNILKCHSEDEIWCNEKQDGLERFGVRNRKHGTHKHSTLMQYKKVLSADVYEGLFKFAVVRNPWDRAISHYFSPHRGAGAWDRREFIDLVNRKVHTMRRFLTVQPKRPAIIIRAFNRFRPLSKRMHEPLAAEMDYILRYESLSDDFQQLCIMIGIPPIALPHRNRSQREHYSHYYDDELQEIVRRKFWEEIEYFGYSFSNN